MLKAQAGDSTRGDGTSRGEYERGRASSRQGGTGISPGKFIFLECQRSNLRPS